MRRREGWRRRCSWRRRRSPDLRRPPREKGGAWPEMADRGLRGKEGKVSLVGAGPGDPRLLTLGALDRLKDADVVIYDRLVSRAVLDMIPRGVAKVYGGKDPGSGGEKEQKKLNDLMLREARSGKNVVRLKGGDPFLFSRGGEEAEFLQAGGVEFEVVPGVSSAL